MIFLEEGKTSLERNPQIWHEQNLNRLLLVKNKIFSSFYFVIFRIYYRKVLNVMSSWFVSLYKEFETKIVEKMKKIVFISSCSCNGRE